MTLPKCFLDLASLYEENGFSLYLIGGTSRDILLGLPCRDYDFVTDATPKEEKAFLLQADYTFAKFGSVKVTFEDVKIDVTTLRKEEGYEDYRHPRKIVFVRDLQEDSLRRDFTVNAIYIDRNGNVIDFHNGMEDLQKKVLRFIGDPWKRIEEDPLRIIRGERFAKTLGFAFDLDTAKAMEELSPLLEKLNPEKVNMERRKMLK